MERAGNFRLQYGLVGRAVPAVGGDPAGHRIPSNAAEHGRIGDAVAAQAVGAVHAARVLAGHEQSRPLGLEPAGIPHRTYAHHVAIFGI